MTAYIKTFAFLASLVLCSTGPALAQNAQTAQQGKMKTCNAEASGLKGDERKAFMKQCLSNQPVAGNTQQNKMKTCNAEAKGKSGEERKAFMSQCLKK